jgi:acyl-CoA reductase-like NAD-dependent aldehyde dehydrogenase
MFTDLELLVNRARQAQQDPSTPEAVRVLLHQLVEALERQARELAALRR